MLVKLGSSVKHVDYNNLKGQNYITENRSKWSFGCQFDLILIFSRKTVTLALSLIKSKSMVTVQEWPEIQIYFIFIFYVAHLV